MKYSEEIFKFKNHYGVEYYQVYKADICIYKDSQCAFIDVCKICLKENYKYAQIEVEILDDRLPPLGYKMSYNTNFQTFTFDENELIIEDKKTKVTIRISNVQNQ